MERLVSLSPRVLPRAHLDEPTVDSTAPANNGTYERLSGAWWIVVAYGSGMGIGDVLATVINVNDLEAGESFWSELTGLPVIASGYAGRFSYLGQVDPWKQEITLQKVDATKGDEPNRVHIDIAPEGGIDEAVERIVQLGGKVKKRPSISPRPGRGDLMPIIDWAVMQDPFGNEFCLVDRLSRDQIGNVMTAAGQGISGDHELRVAAGVTG